MSLFGNPGLSPEELVREAEIKTSLTENLKKALKALQREHLDTTEPIFSEDNANAVCNVLEAIFLHGLKESFSNKCFWPFLTKYTHKDVTSQLNHLGQITTHIGMCRAWIRMALNDGLLESYLDSMLADSKGLADHYRRFAYLRDLEQPGIFKTYVQGLGNYTFQLSYNSSILNVWTTTPLLLAGLLNTQKTPAPVIRQTTSRSALRSTSSVDSAVDVANEPTPPTPSAFPTTAKPPPRVVHSMGRYGAAAGSPSGYPSTPPNSLSSPWDPAQLTNQDIEEIRKMTNSHSKSDENSSTATSQVSHPDPTDARDAFPALEPVSEGTEGHVPVKVRTVKGRGKLKGKGKAKSKSQVKEVTSSSQSSSLTYGSLEDRLMGHVRRDEDDILRDILQDSGAIKEDSASSIRESKQSEEVLDQGKLSQDVSQDDDRDKINVEDKSDLVKNNNNEPEPAMGADEIVDSSEERSGSSQTTEPTTVKPVTRSDTFPQFMAQRKSVAEPTMSDATATQVEIAKELSSGETDFTSSIDESIYRSRPPPRSNSLGAAVMQGWSSEFEESQEERRLLSEVLGTDNNESYESIVEEYGTSPDLNTINALLDQTSNLELSNEQESYSPSSTTQQVGLDTSLVAEEYDVVPDAEEKAAILRQARVQPFLDVMGEICSERGLDVQNYQCATCSRPIGMFYGKARVCMYNAGYYCYECHENDEHFIPSRIIHNWDFRKHKVCKQNLHWLRELEDEPLLNIQQLNRRIYDHVADMNTVKLLRMQLRFLKAYLFTCKQSVADDLRKQVWPKEYFYDDIHLYSLLDLLQVPSGQMAVALKKAISFATKHVYQCRLCSQKGFVCEICNNPKVIYPFEMDETYRCDRCESVFHMSCWPSVTSCPKCARRHVRHRSVMSSPSTDSDYGLNTADYIFTDQSLSP